MDTFVSKVRNDWNFDSFCSSRWFWELRIFSLYHAIKIGLYLRSWLLMSKTQIRSKIRRMIIHHTRVGRCHCWCCSLTSFIYHSTEAYLLLIKIILFSGSDIHTLTLDKAKLHCTNAFNTFSHVFYFFLEMIDSIKLFSIIRLQITFFSLICFKQLIDIFLKSFGTCNCIMFQIF